MDFLAYRNHVYRVYYLAQRFAPNSDPDAFAVAAAFHDLGIWSAGTWDYLDPSIREALSWLEMKPPLQRHGKLVPRMIDFHHKLRRYRGEDAGAVEAFRRADLLDLSLGLCYRRGHGQYNRELKQAFPYQGFHRRLAVFFIRNLVRRPFKPLPMLRF